MSEDQIKAFEGKFFLDKTKSDSAEGFLKLAGIGWAKRKILLALDITLEHLVSEKDGKDYITALQCRTFLIFYGIKSFVLLMCSHKIFILPS